MSSDQATKALTLTRRNKKGALTRSLHTVAALIKNDASTETVVEQFNKCKANLEAVEVAHQALVDSIEDDEIYETVEAWMAEVEGSFVVVRLDVERYVIRRVPGPDKEVVATVVEKEKTTEVSDIKDVKVKDDDSSRPNVNEGSSTGSKGEGDSAFGFSELKLALELPKAEISEFKGDPIDYWSFITNFETNVACRLSGNAARLQYLLQLCKGKARCCIQSCELLGDEGYNKAKAILKRQFGQPHLILNSLMNSLTNRRAVRPNDGEGLWDLIAVMQRCHVTLTQMGYINDLNSTSNLLRVQGLLPLYLQTGWARVAQGILQQREPLFSDLLTYLEGQAEIACNMFGMNIGKSSGGPIRDDKPRVRSNFVKGKSLKCFACDGEHRIFDCDVFLGMSYDQRIDVVKTKRLCFKCLFPGHPIAKCRRDSVCSLCQASNHHQLLHNSSKVDNVHVKSNTAICGGPVFLRIIPVTVTANNGNRVKTFALLDSGSDTSLCSESLKRKLGVQGKSMSYTSTTINGDQTRIGSTFELVVKGEIETDEIFITVLSVSDLPNGNESLPTVRDIDKWQHLKSIPWGEFSKYELGLLIGADSPEAFWVIDEKRGKSKEPYAVKTPLGWSIMGPAGISDSGDRKHIHRISCCANGQILELLEKSWCVKDDDFSEGESVQDKRAQCIMDSTVSITTDGHYQMGLLWKEDDHYLPYNKPMAECRLKGLKTKLGKNRTMLERYTDKMEGYIDKGYAERVDHEGEVGKVWYVPHHPVIHPHKDKLRVVYDCAAKWMGTSLNECLLKGPDTINNLVGVLLRFRRHRVALVADIEAMFHQAKVIDEDRDALRFLWWPGGNLAAEPREYRMTVHLFGATSSPACAGYALQRTASDNEACNQDATGKKAIELIKNDFYVDDLLFAVDDASVAIDLVERLRRIVSKGGFRLTKWLSNDRTVINSIPESERAPTIPASLDKLPTERTLGVNWDAEDDVFRFEVTLHDKPLTRRGLLSTTSSIFDPLGFAAPFVLIARSLLQDVCRKGADWDELLTEDELVMWRIWLQQVSSLSSVQIPRWLRLDNPRCVQLHIFCDASEVGYAAVAYFRVVEFDGEVSCSFVLGKARVTPIKSVSIPRLELMAAVLAVTLDRTIKKEIRLDHDDTVFWTDSMIVLGYIRNEHRRFKTFVANRVSKIRDVSTPQQWRHVGTKENPADDGSRGTHDLKTWLSGPRFLLKPESEWPLPKSDEVDLSTDTEVKGAIVLNVTTYIGDDFLDRLVSKFSSWTKLVRVLAWVIRFVDKSRGASTVNGSNLSVPEIELSETMIIAWLQKAEFQSWRRDPRLVKLQPILLGKLLRVGGRLNNADLSDNAKHPIVLPAKHAVSKLIIRHYHESVGHGGWALTLSAIRQKFWLMNGRTAVKSAMSKCVVCRKLLARPEQQMMATLPSERVSSNKPPFSFVGVDYFGPIETKRGRSVVKRYGCIFTCLTSRAVHLEVADSLDTDSFLNAFRRFVARRGQPEKVFSDNGSNFVAGERELRQSIKALNSDKIESVFHSKGCQWQFNPPTASHFGGAWERLIQSVRRILHGVLRQQTVTGEVLATVLTEVESILNSRPLTDFSSDPRDEEPLTPNHLLLMKEGPDVPVNADKSYGRRRWLQVQYLASLFWKRWQREYLPLLQRRHKWTTPKRNVVVGDIVLLSDETTPRGKWPMGRVMTVVKSSDDKVRSVEVRVRGKVLKRPIAKLCIVHHGEPSV